MTTKINCFIPVKEEKLVLETIKGLKESSLVSKIFLLSTGEFNGDIQGCEVISVDSLNSSATMKKIAEKSSGDFSLIYTKYTTLELGYFALDRLVELAKDSNAAMLYADHYQIADGTFSLVMLTAI